MPTRFCSILAPVALALLAVAQSPGSSLGASDSTGLAWMGGYYSAATTTATDPSITIDTPGAGNQIGGGSTGMGGYYTVASGGADNILVQVFQLDAMGNLINPPVASANPTVTSPAANVRWSASVDVPDQPAGTGRVDYQIVAKLGSGINTVAPSATQNVFVNW